MSIRLKLVSSKEVKKKHIILENCEVITLEYIYNIFKEYGVNIEDLKNTKFITSSEPIKDINKEYITKKDEIRNMYIFTPQTLIKERFESIFDKNGKFTEDDNKKNIIEKLDDKYTKKLDDDHILSEKEISDVNYETENLLNNKDFLSLLNIYKNNPKLFEIFYKFISSGDIINNETIDKDINDFSYEKEYDIMKNMINNISNESIINFTDNQIKNILINFKGHLNLSLRYIICNLD